MRLPCAQHNNLEPQIRLTLPRLYGVDCWLNITMCSIISVSWSVCFHLFGWESCSITHWGYNYTHLQNICGYSSLKVISGMSIHWWRHRCGWIKISCKYKDICSSRIIIMHFVACDRTGILWSRKRTHAGSTESKIAGQFWNYDPRGGFMTPCTCSGNQTGRHTEMRMTV